MSFLTWLWSRQRTRFLVWVALPLTIAIASQLAGQGGAAYMGIVVFWLILGLPYFGGNLIGLVAPVSRAYALPIVLFSMGSLGAVLWMPEWLQGLLIIPCFLLFAIGFICLFFLLVKKDPVALGVEAYEKGDRKGAILSFESAAFFHRAELRGVFLELFRDSQDVELCLGLTEHLTKVAPGEADNWRAHSFFKARAGMVEESIADLERALKLEPNKAEDHYNLGVRLSREPKHYERALKAYDQAIKLDGKIARYWANRAALFNRMGRHESALTNAEKASELDPRDEVAWQQAQVAKAELGQLDEPNQFPHVVGFAHAKGSWVSNTEADQRVFFWDLEQSGCVETDKVELVEALFKKLDSKDFPTAIFQSTWRPKNPGDDALVLLWFDCETARSLGAALANSGIKNLFILCSTFESGALTALAEGLSQLESLGIFYCFSGDDLTDDLGQAKEIGETAKRLGVKNLSILTAEYNESCAEALLSGLQGHQLSRCRISRLDDDQLYPEIANQIGTSS